MWNMKQFNLNNFYIYQNNARTPFKKTKKAQRFVTKLANNSAVSLHPPIPLNKAIGLS